MNEDLIGSGALERDAACGMLSLGVLMIYALMRVITIICLHARKCEDFAS